MRNVNKMDYSSETIRFRMVLQVKVMESYINPISMRGVSEEDPKHTYVWMASAHGS